ncbi:MAG TPA: choice-of-anchor tandem repeat GloVer-containing protein [Stellaceae bacterium]|jgi:uncharacterized repeat protein (TIGR03803 family)|nr:choice-of-anchor tandem repeat GloVer-containing protein [Stellaceae bacterium]
MMWIRELIGKSSLACGFALAFLVPSGGAQANSERVLYNFCSEANCADGFIPLDLARGREGNLYGAADAGGRNDLGAVFRLAADGSYTVLYSFTAKSKDGKYPDAGLVLDKPGNLYGTTADGGNYDYSACGQTGCGTVFRVTPDGKETVLHAFKGTDGYDPSATMILDSKGNLYGTTWAGGASGYGVVFELSPKGQLTVLHSFDGSDGANPLGKLSEDESGNLYGATANGGTGTNCEGGACGVIFELAADGTFGVLHDFQGTDGATPFGPLVPWNKDLYGVTVGGASTCGPEGQGCGAAFKLAPDGTLTLLHIFLNGSDGGYPVGGLIADQSGNLYGVTANGGNRDCENEFGCGLVFRLTTKGLEKVLYSFRPYRSGSEPEAGLIMDGHGNLYGTTWEGGADGLGTLFEIRN